MALWSMVRRLFVHLVISCRRCNWFSISDTQPVSLDDLVRSRWGIPVFDFVLCLNNLFFLAAAFVSGIANGKLR